MKTLREIKILSQMEYEDWRPKPHQLTPFEIEMFRQMANAQQNAASSGPIGILGGIFGRIGV